MKKVLSIALLLALVLSCVCVASAETNPVSNTFWKFSFMGQSTCLHFYDDDTVYSTNGQVSHGYTWDLGTPTKSYPIKNGTVTMTGSVRGRSAFATANVTMGKAMKTIKLTNVKGWAEGSVRGRSLNHNVNVAGTFTLKRIKPTVKKITYTKVSMGTPTTLTMSFNEACECYKVFEKKTGKVLAEGEVENGTATCQITFNAKSNKIYVQGYLCDKAGNAVASTASAKKAKTVSCKK